MLSHMAVSSRLADDKTLLARVDDIARGPLAKIVVDIDQKGHYPLEIMRLLGESGALGAHLQTHGGDFGLALRAMATVSRECGATGFLGSGPINLLN
ncbi:acyl-CoA dehydrogenase family protein [Acetobacter persici]|uniref:acyl-CoA dehydrogenase family protein n=1 Tax=Acetobacter persici TaxID=1076596 RepID=UPI0036D9616D